MEQVLPLNVNFEVSDLSGQHALKVRNFPSSATIGEMVRGLVEKLGLSRADPNGRPYVYHAQLEREGRHLHASEVVSEAIREGDQVVFQPSIQAG